MKQGHLNYCFALLQAKTRLGTADRDSMALDLVEPIRPEVEAWLRPSPSMKTI